MNQKSATGIVEQFRLEGKVSLLDVNFQLSQGRAAASDLQWQRALQGQVQISSLWVGK